MHTDRYISTKTYIQRRTDRKRQAERQSHRHIDRLTSGQIQTERGRYIHTFAHTRLLTLWDKGGHTDQDWHTHKYIQTGWQTETDR